MFDNENPYYSVGTNTMPPPKNLPEFLERQTYPRDTFACTVEKKNDTWQVYYGHANTNQNSAVSDFSCLVRLGFDIFSKRHMMGGGGGQENISGGGGVASTHNLLAMKPSLTRQNSMTF